MPPDVFLYASTAAFAYDLALRYAIVRDFLAFSYDMSDEAPILPYTASVAAS